MILFASPPTYPTFFEVWKVWNYFKEEVKKLPFRCEITVAKWGIRFSPDIGVWTRVLKLNTNIIVCLINTPIIMFFKRLVSMLLGGYCPTWKSCTNTFINSNQKISVDFIKTTITSRFTRTLVSFSCYTILASTKCRSN